MLNLVKLARIEERTEEKFAAARAIFARYRERVEASKRFRAHAVALNPNVHHLSLAQLNLLDADEVASLSIDAKALAAANVEMAAATDLKARHQRASAASAGEGELLHRLQRYADPGFANHD